MIVKSDCGSERRGSPWRIAGWSAAALLLMLPLVAMQFTDEVNWGAEDFVAAAILLGGTGLAFELAARKTRDRAYRVAVGVALAAALLLVWINLAVGIIGSEDNAANLMYAGVLAVGITGALIARFRPRGMARAMFATALAQSLVTVIAVAGELGAPWSGPRELLALNAFFVALWLGSAWLFRHTAGRPNDKLRSGRARDRLVGGR